MWIEQKWRGEVVWKRRGRSNKSRGVKYVHTYSVDNAICKVLSPLINELDSKTPLDCSCVSDGTGLNIGGDAECSIKIGPPPLDALKDLKIEFHAGTTVRPCATPATVSVEAGITLPTPSSTE